MAINEQAPSAAGTDEEALHRMGYAQELRRRMSGFSNFAVSFTIISILSGCLTLYGFGMITGGPAVIVWGWPFVGIMTLFVGLAMAEVCSSFPTAGGLYYWAAKLARKNGPAWSWFTGWFNFLGQVAVTAGIDFGAALFINAFGVLEWGSSSAHSVTILIYAIVLLVHGMLNQFGIRLVALLNDVSVWWHMLGVLDHRRCAGLRPEPPSARQLCLRPSGEPDRAEPRLVVHHPGRPADRPVHLHRLRRLGAHDRGDAQRRHRGPRGIVMSIIVSLFAGWVLLIGMTFAIQTAPRSQRPRGRPLPRRSGSTRSGPPARSSAADRHRRPVVLRHVLGHRELANDLRVLPGRRAAGLGLWHKVNKRTRTPTNAIWLAAGAR